MSVRRALGPVRATRRVVSGLRDLVVGGKILPRDLLVAKFARSGGPGGQNVNKVASKVDLRLDLEGARAILGDAAVARAKEKLAPRLDRDGWLVVTSSEHRDQPRNLDAALSRMETLLEAAIARPKRRIATRATKGSKERRLAEKRRRAETKRGRTHQT